MRIALDAMGGDHAPAAAVKGALLYARKAPTDTIILVGDQSRLESELARLPAHEGLEIRHAPQAVGMEEHPSAVVRGKRESSLHVGLQLVRQGMADAMVSAGNSGALMAVSLAVLGSVPGIDRPAIVTTLPTLNGRWTALLDSGATVSCRPEHLVQFAHLGAVYARQVLGIAHPKVALLSNGTEIGKGTELTRAARAILERSSLRFEGYVEGNSLFAGEVDVVVTDGFTGNVVLKTTEGAATALGAMLKREVETRSTARLGWWLGAPAFAAFQKIVDWREYGGAPLLGVNGVVLVAHGRSGPRAMANALRAAAKAASRSMASELIQAASAARSLGFGDRAESVARRI